MSVTIPSEPMVFCGVFMWRELFTKPRPLNRCSERCRLGQTSRFDKLRFGLGCVQCAVLCANKVIEAVGTYPASFLRRSGLCDIPLLQIVSLRLIGSAECSSISVFFANFNVPLFAFKKQSLFHVSLELVRPREAKESARIEWPGPNAPSKPCLIFLPLLEVPYFERDLFEWEIVSVESECRTALCTNTGRMA